MTTYRDYLDYCLLHLGKGMGGQKKIAQELGVTPKQIGCWESGKAPMRKRDFRALRDLMQEARKQGTKSAVQSRPTCKYCNKEIIIKEELSGLLYTVNHKCPSGFIHKLFKRSREEALRALAPVVSEKIII